MPKLLVTYGSSSSSSSNSSSLSPSILVYWKHVIELPKVLWINASHTSLDNCFATNNINYNGTFNLEWRE